MFLETINMPFTINDILQKNNSANEIKDLPESNMAVNNLYQRYVNYPYCPVVFSNVNNQSYTFEIEKRKYLEYNSQSWTFFKNSETTTNYRKFEHSKEQNVQNWSPCITYSKRKGDQIRFSLKQTDVLEKKFRSAKYITPEERKILAGSLNLSERQVKTWFQNRRAKWRRYQASTQISSRDKVDNKSSK